MSALPRPEVTGPARTLNDALHDLHHRAGWPSLRTLAKEAGVSHTTVSKVFSSDALPGWGTLEILVEAMDGDTAQFHGLWLAASTPTDGGRPPPPRIAGRKTELDAVRRHLEAGTGLLLVTGEAGMGKTKLVTTAIASTDTFVAVGHCLPLSTEVPLLPVADAVRAAHEHGGGVSLGQALAGCPPYVTSSISRLLPDIALRATVPDVEDTWSRQRLFQAVGETFAALGARRSVALLIEDLHWADTATLDLLEHLVARNPGVPLVGTWRTDDPDTRATHREWRHRLERAASVTVLDLGLLSRDETGDLLRSVTGGTVDAAYVDLIHRRSIGQPLFAEQLASQAQDQPLPRVLADLLDRRIDALGAAASAVVDALGVADRALRDDVISRVTGLGTAELVGGLRELSTRRLAAADPGPDRVQLRHPLVAEAVRRRLTGLESRDMHRRLALALADMKDSSPAEVAAHWEAAQDVEEERTWRIHAARAADARFAGAQAALHWQRVLELWPGGTHELAAPPISLPEVYLSAMDALDLAGESSRGLQLAQRALQECSGWELADRAEILRKIAAYMSPGGEVAGDRLSTEAIDLYRQCPQTAEVVDRLAIALIHQAFTFSFRGRLGEAVHTLEEAQSLLAAQDPVPTRLREVRSMLAWHAAVEGGIDQALREMADIARLVPDRPEPVRDVVVALNHTDALLLAAHPPEAVEAAAENGLAAARTYGLDTYESNTLLANVVIAWTRAGRIGRAAALIDEITEPPPALDRWVLHMQRALIDQARGRMDDARDRADRVRRLDRVAVAFMAVDQATIRLWDGHPGPALDLVEEAVMSPDHVEVMGETGHMLAIAAHAAADLAAAGGHDPTALAARVKTLRSAVHRDPFGTTAVPADRHAGPRWFAELARLEGVDSIEQWTSAADVAHRIGRPHDAAYCRWRAAQCAVRESQGTVAARLLKRAAVDAREHVPLSRAIAGTAAR